jgi:hypothetical protein
MNLIDANLLLLAHNSASEQHRAARHWIEGVFSSTEPVGIAGIAILGFLRLATNPRVLIRPLAERGSVAVVDPWLRVRAVRVFDPGSRHWSILSGLIVDGQVRGSPMQDACLTARGAVGPPGCYLRQRLTYFKAQFYTASCLISGRLPRRGSCSSNTPRCFPRRV